jgi:Endoplasmic reticulum vesicle transporter
MKITKTNNSLSKFLISLCAIVGGVFVIYGLINGAYQQLKKVVLGTN